MANYDQVWLFGFSTSALAAPEQAVIAQFMQGGGGVFATGDHETIGAGMGANIPRVRTMRNWATIPMSNPNRHDTVLDPGADNVKQFQDQADAIPQRIYPVFFSNGGPDDAASTWSVHPVLLHSSGAVDYLPDHPHESECLAPTPVAGNFAGVEEWPTPIGGGSRIAAQIAAVSISAGRFITDVPKPPVKPRCFGAISTYDGDPAQVGRIVCDATWHHFVNINLNGSGAGIDPSTGLARTGLYAAGSPTPEYLKIQQYYLNTVRWLAPRGRRSCWIFTHIAILRFDFELAEMRIPEPLPNPWDPLIRIGLVAEAAATRIWGPGALTELVDEILGAAGNDVLTKLLKARHYPSSDAQGKAAAPSLLPVQDIRRAIIGSVLNLAAHKLPWDEEKAADVLKKKSEKFAHDLISEGVRGAEQAIRDYLDLALKHSAMLAQSLQARK
jgi:hypothetical protein